MDRWTDELPLGEWDLRSDGQLLLGTLDSDLRAQLTGLAVKLDSLQQISLLFGKPSETTMNQPDSALFG